MVGLHSSAILPNLHGYPRQDAPISYHIENGGEERQLALILAEHAYQQELCQFGELFGPRGSRLLRLHIDAKRSV